LQLDKNPVFSSDFKCKNSEKIFSEWGRINKEYADKKCQASWIAGNIANLRNRLFMEALINHVLM